ncbi:MAG: ribonuclease HII [Gammaproteobacteria bacterium]|nr:ribonuclease HII [Gammaproteobacteria bacterium]|tara:strand:+ start:710 stop:1315 length:606 start_codon:yes stop_codon:yes gene_type:complete
MYQSDLLNRYEFIAGVDEAGRGSLAGPVVASAVLLDLDDPIEGLSDSKKLSEKIRCELEVEIKKKSLAWSVAWASSKEIDNINILQATMLAMRRAIIELSVKPDKILVDGNCLPNFNFEGNLIPGETIIGGDNKILSISAASIIAKTTRDKIMYEIDKRFPIYEFAKHKGYGTKIHFSKLHEFGPCCEHRQTFSPMKELNK